MNNIFETTWADIRQRLKPGTLVRNWSSDRGYTGGEFRINDVDGSAVVIRSGQMDQERRVSRGDFERLSAFWSAYNQGKIGRVELGKHSQNTTYILSILHWREANQEAASPSAVSPPVPVITKEPTATLSASVLAGHDDYGKRVLSAASNRAILYGRTVEINYGAGQPARIDATVGDIAIEIESRVSKQVRGAVLDLICHPLPKKLLMLLPVHMSNPAVTAEQCRHILALFCPPDSYRVLLLKGRGDAPQLIDDTATVAAALIELGEGSPVLTG